MLIFPACIEEIIQVKGLELEAKEREYDGGQDKSTAG